MAALSGANLKAHDPDCKPSNSTGKKPFYLLFFMTYPLAHSAPIVLPPLANQDRRTPHQPPQPELLILDLPFCLELLHLFLGASYRRNPEY
jgi:hypothetical protein